MENKLKRYSYRSKRLKSRVKNFQFRYGSNLIILLMILTAASATLAYHHAYDINLLEHKIPCADLQQSD